MVAAALASGAGAFTLAAAQALAVPTANLYAVPTGGVSSGSYPGVCTQTTPCTLAWAIDQSNNNSVLDGYAVVINLAAGNYTGGETIEAGGDAPYTVELDGAAASTTTISGGGTVRTLYVDGVGYEVIIANLTLSNGNSGSSDGGNLLAAPAADEAVVLNDDVVTGGQSEPGGQVDATSGYLDVDNTTVENSVNDTYGSYADGSSSLSVLDSTYSNNDADAIASGASGTATVKESTIVGSPFGVLSKSTATSTVTDSTVSGNTTGGLTVVAGSIAVSGSIFANNAGHDCETTGITDGGNNVIDDSSCGFGTSHGSRVFTAAQIGLLPLANNGGPTETERITATSAAHDFLPTVSDCEGYDERGLVQLQPGQTDCDAGAYQYAPPILSAVSPANLEPGSSTRIELTGQNLNYAKASFGSANVATTVDDVSGTELFLGMPSAAQLPLGSQPITVTNADGTATIGFTASGPTIGALPATTAAVGQRFAETYPVTGAGAGPITFTLSSGALPAGLTLSSSGTVSGTPTAAGTASFTIKVVDGFGVTVTSPESLTVVAPTIQLESPKVALNPGGAWVKLTCGTAPCSGSGKLTLTERVHVKHGDTIKTKVETIVLARTSYYVVNGSASGLAILSLTKAGVKERTLLRHSKGSVSATVVITLAGGASLTAPVKLSAKSLSKG